MMGQSSKMPCYGAGIAQVTNTLRQRFQLQLSADDAERFVETDMIGKSLGSYYTRLYVRTLLSFFLFSFLYPVFFFPLQRADAAVPRYDTFQYRTQGIY